jgi:hypothetical protein
VLHKAAAAIQGRGCAQFAPQGPAEILLALLPYSRDALNEWGARAALCLANILAVLAIYRWVARVARCRVVGRCWPRLQPFFFRGL